MVVVVVVGVGVVVGVVLEVEVGGGVVGEAQRQIKASTDWIWVSGEDDRESEYYGMGGTYFALVRVRPETSEGL